MKLIQNLGCASQKPWSGAYSLGMRGNFAKASVFRSMTVFVAPGGFNGSSGNWELVVDKKNKLIVHYLYTSGSKK